MTNRELIPPLASSATTRIFGGWWADAALSSFMSAAARPFWDGELIGRSFSSRRLGAVSDWRGGGGDERAHNIPDLKRHHGSKHNERDHPKSEAFRAEASELASYDCVTRMLVVRLIAPALAGEDHAKDIDFSRSGIRYRWRAGYADTKRVLAQTPWPATPLVITAVPSLKF
jgi:Patatin phospholipase